MSTVLEGTAIEKVFRLGRREIPVLRGANISVFEGEIAALVGASGAGKSTLLHVLGLLDPPTRGTVTFRGHPVSNLRAGDRARFRHERIGFVFQFYHLIPELSALQNVCLGAMMLSSWVSYLKRRRAVIARAKDILADMGLDQRLKHKPAQLSGGERQRVAIARALIAEPAIILADEPTGNLDSATAAEILDVLWKINEEKGISFLLVTHDERLARRADRIVRLHDGKTVGNEVPGHAARAPADTPTST